MLRLAIEKLPSSLQSPYILRAQDRSHRGIDISLNTVGTRIRRARHFLKTILEAECASQHEHKNDDFYQDNPHEDKSS